MAYCANCGNPMEEGTAFCAACGAKAAGAAGPAPASEPAAPEYPADKQLGYGAMAILAYTGLLFLVPWLAGKESPFAQYHANQGLVLFLAGIISSAAFFLLGWILRSIFWPLGSIATVLSVGVSITLTVFGVMGMVYCCQGRMKPVPLLGGIRIIK